MSIKTTTLLTASAAVCIAASTAGAAETGNWREYNGDKAGSRLRARRQRHRAERQIDEGGVARAAAGEPDLGRKPRVAHLGQPVHAAGDQRRAVRQLAAGTSSARSTAATGKTLWTWDGQGYVDGTPPNLGFISRGLTYWEKGADKRLFVGSPDAYLVALDPKTGKPIESFGDKGRIDLTKGLRRPVDRSLVSPTTPAIILRWADHPQHGDPRLVRDRPATRCAPIRLVTCAASI